MTTPGVSHKDVQVSNPPSPQLSNYQKILNSKQALHDLLQHSTKYVENRSDTKLLLLCRYHCFWRRVSLTHSLVVIDHLWRYVLFPTWFTLVCVTHFYFLLTLFEKLSCKQVGPGFPPLNETYQFIKKKSDCILKWQIWWHLFQTFIHVHVSLYVNLKAHIMVLSNCLFGINCWQSPFDFLTFCNLF